MKYLFVLLFSLILFTCNETKPEPLDANEIIEKSIEISGVDKLNVSVLEFDFRNIHYIAERKNGRFKLTRVINDSLNEIKDHLSNKGFSRYVNDSAVYVPDSMATKYSASVNSVHYFAVLPYGLDAKAVHKTYMNDVEIKGESYHKIKVTFDEDGGGEDFEDVFVYWVNIETSKIDYLAYSYNEDNGIGLRFREAYNERYIKGVRFVDYKNYKPIVKSVGLEDLDRLFMGDELELLSKIELKNVSIN